MSSKVVTLNGIPLPVPGEAVESLVAGLERLLEKAKNGDIHGVAVAMSFSDGSTGHNCYGTIHNTYALIGRLHNLIYERNQDLDKENT